MNTKVAIIIGDFSTWGGVETITKQLLKTKIPFWGMIGLGQKHNPPKTSYPPHIQLYVISNEQQIARKLKENQITHSIIISFDLKKTLKIIEELKVYHIKSIYFFHNTPYIYTPYLIKKSFSPLMNIYIEVSNFIKKLINYRRSYASYLIENIIDKSHHFLVLSEHIVKETKFLTPYRVHSKIDYMYNIVSVEENVKPKENTIVFAGRLTDYKRALLTVKTLAPILKHYPDWRFYILGDGEEYSLIEDYLIENDIKNIHLCGKVDNVHEYLAKSKICLLYSLFEGLPTILLEAGMLENALISYNSRGGVRNIIKHENNGFIVKNETELSEKVEFLIKNPDILDRMRIKNKDIFKKFEHSKIIAKWEKILDIPEGVCQ